MLNKQQMVNEMQTAAIKTLIDLCPGTRLPQYEEGIFSNKKLTKYYLRKLYDRYDHDDPVPGMAYYYAKFVMKCRWPEAEAIIATDPRWAYFYAWYVMKSRWPEAEAIIATNRYYGDSYNQDFGTNI